MDSARTEYVMSEKPHHMSDIHRQAMRDQDLLFSTLTHFLQGSLPLAWVVRQAPLPVAFLLCLHQSREGLPLPAAAGLYPSLSPSLCLLGNAGKTFALFLPVGYLLKVAVRWVSCLPAAYLCICCLKLYRCPSLNPGGGSACIARSFI